MPLSEDHGDSLCYLIGRIAPDTPKYAETRVRDQFDPTGLHSRRFFPGEDLQILTSPRFRR